MIRRCQTPRCFAESTLPTCPRCGADLWPRDANGDLFHTKPPKPVANRADKDRRRYLRRKAS